MFDIVADGRQCDRLIPDAKLALRRLASSVSVVTCRHDGQNYAMTATSVSAISMAPPSMLVCINQSAAFHRALNNAQEFAINILSRAHVKISRLCSGGASGESRFETGYWDTRAVAPVLVDAQAAIICRKDKSLEYGNPAQLSRIKTTQQHNANRKTYFLDSIGHQRRVERALGTSGLAGTPKADILLRHNICRDGPFASLRTAEKQRAFSPSGHLK